VLTLKVLGPLLVTTGSVVLAWRVKTILDSLVLAQSAAEANFLSLTAFLSGSVKDLKIVGGLDEHVERSQRRGIWLLVVGFLLIAAGASIGAFLGWREV
jgi:hypothetical protein